MFKPSDLLDLSKSQHPDLFSGVDYVWEVLKRIAPYLKENLKPAIHAQVVGKPHIGGQVFIGKGTIVDPGAYIIGPAWIGEGCHIRHGAYIRENVIVGNSCVLGNSCEFKNSVLFDSAQVPHFSYVGDTIMGVGAHLGAGVIMSNLKLDKTLIQVRHDGKIYDTGLKKFGAIVGDRAEVGCNSVLNPGSIIGRDSIVYPGTMWRGVLPESSIGRGDTRLHTTPRRSLKH